MKIIKKIKFWLARLAGFAARRILTMAAMAAFLNPAFAVAGVVLAVVDAVYLGISIAYAVNEVVRWVKEIQAGIEAPTSEEMAMLGVKALNEIACSYVPPCLGPFGDLLLSMMGGAGSGGGDGGPSDDRGSGGPAVGNPVAVAAGIKWQVGTDFEALGRFPLLFQRTYLSAQPKNDGFIGAKWSATYFQRVRLPQRRWLTVPAGAAA